MFRRGPVGPANMVGTPIGFFGIRDAHLAEDALWRLKDQAG